MRIITFLVGYRHESKSATLTGWGLDPIYSPLFFRFFRRPATAGNFRIAEDSVDRAKKKHKRRFYSRLKKSDFPRSRIVCRGFCWQMIFILEGRNSMDVDMSSGWYCWWKTSQIPPGMYTYLANNGISTTNLKWFSRRISNEPSPVSWHNLKWWVSITRRFNSSNFWKGNSLREDGKFKKNPK